MDARWTVQFGKARTREDGKPQPDIAIPTFGYKAHTSIDRRYRFGMALEPVARSCLTPEVGRDRCQPA